MVGASPTGKSGRLHAKCCARIYLEVLPRLWCHGLAFLAAHARRTQPRQQEGGRYDTRIFKLNHALQAEPHPPLLPQHYAGCVGGVAQSGPAALPGVFLCSQRLGCEVHATSALKAGRCVPRALFLPEHLRLGICAVYGVCASAVVSCPLSRVSRADWRRRDEACCVELL